MDKVRCTVCKGSKLMMKLGAILGKCTLCNGKGEIDPSQIPQAVVVKLEPVVNREIIDQISNVVPVVLEESDLITVPKDVDIKIDGKKAIYKRKTIAK